MIIIKIGGGAAINTEGVADDLADMGTPCVIVHGANAARDDLARRLGYEKRTLTSVSGVSSVFSDDEAIDVMMMAYSGLRNKRIVEAMQVRGVNAMGLTGLDGRAVQGRRNQGIRVREGGKLRIVRDNSGKPREVNTGLLGMLLDAGYTPVLTPPIADENGRAINTENDDVVRVLQEALGAEQIIQLIEARGMLRDVADPESLIERLSRAELARMVESADGRIKRKLMAIARLLDAGAENRSGAAPRVIIADGRVEHPVRDALAGQGTIIG